MVVDAKPYFDGQEIEKMEIWRLIKFCWVTEGKTFRAKVILGHYILFKIEAI